MCATTPSPEVCYLPTNEAYDRWSSVYDTDGNFLQNVDDAEMESWLLPRFLTALRNHHSNHRTVVDLGCGTGRNTARLLSSSATDIIDQVIALDASQGMLGIAQTRLSPLSSSEIRGTEGTEEHITNTRLHLIHHDLLSTRIPPELAHGTADAVISTLVLEHVPLQAFFEHVAVMLKPGGSGLLLLTNMHADMGRISQAGFVDVETGVKVRPKSYAHTVADVLTEANRWGFSVLKDDTTGVQKDGTEGESVPGVKEVTVHEGLVEMLGSRSRKWVGVTCWFGCLLKMERSFK